MTAASNGVVPPVAYSRALSVSATPPGTHSRAVWFAGLAAIDSAYVAPFYELVREFTEADVRLAIADSVDRKMEPLLAYSWGAAGLPENHDLEALKAVTRIANEELFAAFEGLVQGLDERSIPSVLIKGADLALTLFTHVGARAMFDIDVLVHAQDIERTRTVFTEDGFVQGVISPSSRTMQRVSDVRRRVLEQADYELLPFVKWVRVPRLDMYAPAIERLLAGNFCYRLCGSEVHYALEFDVHRNLSPIFDEADIWTDLRRIDLLSSTTLAQSFTDQVWFMASRLYDETMKADKPNLRGFVDLVRLIAAKGAEIDWFRVETMAAKYGLQSALFYTLLHVREILPESPSIAAIPRFEAASAVEPRLNDYGDLFPKLFESRAAGDCS